MSTIINAASFIAIAYLAVGFAQYVVLRLRLKAGARKFFTAIDQACEPDQTWLERMQSADWEAIMTSDPDDLDDEPSGSESIVTYAPKTAAQAATLVIPIDAPNDAELIRLAKDLARQGRYSKAALKWSFNRPIGQKTRDELIRLMGGE